jgi:hypothetical protein
VKTEVRRAVRPYRIGIAMKLKTDPKSFFRYVGRQLKTSKIVQLIKEDGSVLSEKCKCCE